MHRRRISLTAGSDAGIRPDFHGRAAVAKIPGLPGRDGGGRSHDEGHRVSGPDVQTGKISRVHGGGRFVGASSFDHIHDGEIIGHMAAVVGRFKNFTVPSRLVVCALNLRTDRRRAVAKSPLVLGDPDTPAGSCPPRK